MVAGIGYVCYLQVNVADLIGHLKKHGVAVKWILLFLDRKDFVGFLVGTAVEMVAQTNVAAGDVAVAAVGAVDAVTEEAAVPVHVAVANGSVDVAAEISVAVAERLIADCFAPVQVGSQILSAL